MAWFKKRNTAGERETSGLPRHIAIILDGNGRWAKKRGLPRTAGHAAGSENFRKIATYCRDIGVDYLTVYAFSTENWKRPEDEVKSIMKLLEKYLHEAIDTMERDGAQSGAAGASRQDQRDFRALRGLSGEHLPQLRRARRDNPRGEALCARRRRGQGGRRAYGGAVLRLPLFRRYP